MGKLGGTWGKSTDEPRGHPKGQLMESLGGFAGSLGKGVMGSVAEARGRGLGPGPRAWGRGSGVGHGFGGQGTGPGPGAGIRGPGPVAQVRGPGPGLGPGASARGLGPGLGPGAGARGQAREPPQITHPALNIDLKLGFLTREPPEDLGRIGGSDPTEFHQDPL